MGVKKLALILIIVCVGIGIESIMSRSYTFVFSVCLPALFMSISMYTVAKIGLPKCAERIKNLKRSWEASPEHAEICYDLGIAYAMRDMDSTSRREAIKQLERFVELFPEHALRPEADKALKMLKNKFRFFYYLAGKHGFRYSGEILKKGISPGK